MPTPEDDLRALVDALLNMNAGLERARRHTKGSSQFGLLQVVADHDGIRPSAIADRLELHPSSVARQVRESEAAGFVRVTHDPADLRSLRICLEPAGSEELRRLLELGRARIVGFVDDWDPEQVRTLTRLLEKLRASIETAAAQERRSRRRPPAGHGGGVPDWFTDWLGG